MFKVYGFIIFQELLPYFVIWPFKQTYYPENAWNTVHATARIIVVPGNCVCLLAFNWAMLSHLIQQMTLSAYLQIYFVLKKLSFLLCNITFNNTLCGSQFAGCYLLCPNSTHIQLVWVAHAIWAGRKKTNSGISVNTQMHILDKSYIDTKKTAKFPIIWWAKR